MATKAPPVPTAKNSITQAGKVIYLNNKELLAEVKKSKKKGQMSDALAKMLQLLCSKYAKKGNFVNYSYNEDMQAYAMMMLVRTWNSFNPEKSNNPFAFFTQCVKNSFIQYLNHEQRQRDVRDLLLIDSGLNPSYGYDDNDEGGPKIEDERDFDTIRSTLELQTRTRYSDSPIERDDKGTEVAPVEVPVEQDDTPELVQY
jgi:DNA-directed RNA polymerase specialized sigma24 family protein